MIFLLVTGMAMILPIVLYAFWSLFGWYGVTALLVLVTLDSLVRGHPQKNNS